jgi:hypothetical protein
MERLADWWRPLSNQTKGIVVLVAFVAIVAIGASGSSGSKPAAPTPVLNVVPAPTTAQAVPATPAVSIAAAVTPEPTPTPTPEPTPTPIEYLTLTNRPWALIMKAPDDHVGEYYKVYACITQFDAATGSDTFRAQASYEDEGQWLTAGTNALFTGDAGDLADFVTNDVVLMDVVVLGSFSYDTQIGGKATVPLFRVDVISRKGSCS